MDFTYFETVLNNFCLHISSDAKYFFLSGPRHSDWGLLSIIFQIWKKKNTLLLVALLAVTWVPCILRHSEYIHAYIFIYIYWLIGLVSRVFANGLGGLGSITGRVIPKTLKWYLIPPCLTLSNLRYVLRVKWSNPGKEVAPFPTPRCSSCWKGSLLVTLNFSCQLYLLYFYIPLVYGDIDVSVWE